MGKKTIDITIGCKTQTVTFTCSDTSPMPHWDSDFNADFNYDFGTSLKQNK